MHWRIGNSIWLHCEINFPSGICTLAMSAQGSDCSVAKHEHVESQHCLKCLNVFHTKVFEGHYDHLVVGFGATGSDH